MDGVVAIVLYVVFVAIGDLVAWRIGAFVEARWPTASLLVFLAMFFAVLVIAWPLAARAAEQIVRRRAEKRLARSAT
jgi:hypothetical protein